MLKVVVFDSGYGGEFFADKLQEELPIIEIIRVIDWRNANKYLTNPKKARRLVSEALRPYIGHVNLIIFANHLLTITSLKYFKRKYQNQNFIGLHLKIPDTFVKHDLAILTTKAVTRTISYHNYLFQIKRRIKTLVIDSWPAKIDEGVLTEDEIRHVIKKFIHKENINPQEIILACSHFDDIKTELKNILGKSIKIHDSFDDALRETCKILNIRGRTGKKVS